MTDLRIDSDAALAAYDEHGGKHSEALQAALDAGVHLAVIQMRAIEEYADERDDQRDRVIAALDDALGEGSCVERDITDAIRELAKERDDALSRVQVIAAVGLDALDLAHDHGVENCEDGCSQEAARIAARLKELATSRDEVAL